MSKFNCAECKMIKCINKVYAHGNIFRISVWISGIPLIPRLHDNYAPISYLLRKGLRTPLEVLVVRFKESINRAARKRAPEGGREGEIERGSSAIVRRINNAAGTRFRALYCRSAYISARPSIVRDLSGLRTTYPLTGYIATTTTTTALRCLV